MEEEFESRDAGLELSNYEAQCWANGANFVLEKVRGMDSVTAEIRHQLTEWVNAEKRK